MLVAMLAGMLASGQATGSEPRPDEAAPLWAYGLTADRVPATDYPPTSTAPAGPIEVWLWQFLATRAEGFDSIASRIRIDCQAGTYQFLGHAGYLEGEHQSSDPRVEGPAAPPPGSVGAGLLTHVCDPDPDREVRRYANHRTARETFDAFFAGR